MYCSHGSSGVSWIRKSRRSPTISRLSLTFRPVESNVIGSNLSYYLPIPEGRLVCTLHFADGIDLLIGSNSELQDFTNKLFEEQEPME